MSSQIIGLTVTSLIPGPDANYSRDPQGKMTGSRTFSCLKNALASGYIQNRLAKGTPITTLCSDVPAQFQFLQVDSFTSQDNPSGITTVAVQFTGYIESDSSEFGFDREITYSLASALTERPIIEHPNFIATMKEAHASEYKGIIGLYRGTMHVGNPTEENPEVIDTQTDVSIVTITDETSLLWYKTIFIDNIRTYQAPQFEWTKAGANAGGLSDADLAQYGKKDTPPGSPPEPTGETGWWQLIDVTDSRSSNASSYSLTWRFNAGAVIAHIYDY